MADAKKTTKKAAEVKTVDQLRADIEAKRTDLLEAKRSHAAGELANPRVITATRKEIARLLTVLAAEETKEQKESK